MQNQILVKCFFGKTPCSYIFLVNMNRLLTRKMWRRIVNILIFDLVFPSVCFLFTNLKHDIKIGPTLPFTVPRYFSLSSLKNYDTVDKIVNYSRLGRPYCGIYPCFLKKTLHRNHQFNSLTQILNKFVNAKYVHILRKELIRT